MAARGAMRCRSCWITVRQTRIQEMMRSFDLDRTELKDLYNTLLRGGLASGPVVTG